MPSSRISENGVSFSGAGGHSHNGVNSSIIDVNSYSLFDFSLGYKGSQSRINSQGTNQAALEEWVIRTINSKVLQPAGLTLDPNTLSGKSIRANTITATELQANTITADEIASNTITASELTANFVLINNIIRSSNYNGTIGVITAQGSAGWAITYAGAAEFSSASIRGAITANSVSTPGIDILSDGSISSTNFNVTATGNITAVNADITGTVTASSGTIGGWGIEPTKLSKTSGFNSVELIPSLTNQTTSAIKIRYDNPAASTIYQSTLAAQTMYITNTSGSLVSSTTVDYTGVYIDQGGLDSTSINFYGATINGPVKVPSGNNIKATTTFRTSGSSTTARVTQGDEPGFDNLCRPTSLRELKENIEDIPDALSILSDLRPRTYNFKVDAFSPVDPNTQQPWTEEARSLAQLDLKYGFIVEEIFDKRPELVSYSHEYTTDDPYEEGGYFDFSSWKPTMWEDIDVLVLCVKAIQELSQKNQELESRLQALEGV